MPFRDRHEKDDEWEFLNAPGVGLFEIAATLIFYWGGIAVMVLILRMFIF
jgi:hypothetical protein